MHWIGKPGAGPHGKVLHGPHRARSGRRREHTGSTECGSGALRHHRKFAFPAEIVADIALGKQLADQGRRFALRRNRIGNHHIDTGAPDGFFNDFAPGIERQCEAPPSS